MENEEMKNVNIADIADNAVNEQTLAQDENVEQTQTEESVHDVTEQTASQNEENTQDEEKDDKNDNVVEYVYKEMSPLRMVGRRFFRSKLSIVGLVMIVFLILFSFLGPVVYDKWGEETVDRSPVVTTIRNVYEKTNDDGETIKIREVVQHESGINSYADPSKDHLLGTDDKGMDVFVRLMYGGRISLTIGFIVVILETLIGIVLGGLAGYFGGWVDQVIMRIVDIFTCVPTLPILLIASAMIDSWQVSPDTRIYLLMAIITIFSWSGVARLVRGQILSLREQEYITATEVMGLPTWRKIFVHLIPNVMPQLIVSMTLGLGSVILYESTLSFLNLGVQLPKAAWGTMIATSNDPQVLSYHMNMWLPAGVMIVIAVLGFNFVGDGLRDAMDPKAKK